MNNNLTNLEEILLLFISREEYLKKIRMIANDYDIIITDRWLMSIRTMQGIEECDLPIIYELECKMERFGKPDITFILDVDEKKCRERISSRNKKLDRIESRSLSFHKKVRDNFLRIGLVQPNTYILDGSKSKDSISKDIYEISTNFINVSRGNAYGSEN